MQTLTAKIMHVTTMVLLLSLRSNLRASNFKKFHGGVCPQTPQSFMLMHVYIHIRHPCNPPSKNHGYGPDTESITVSNGLQKNRHCFADSYELEQTAVWQCVLDRTKLVCNSNNTLRVPYAHYRDSRFTLQKLVIAKKFRPSKI